VGGCVGGGTSDEINTVVKSSWCISCQERIAYQLSGAVGVSVAKSSWCISCQEQLVYKLPRAVGVSVFKSG
jgi:hypothetical protein